MSNEIKYKTKHRAQEIFIYSQEILRKCFLLAITMIILISIPGKYFSNLSPILEFSCPHALNFIHLHSFFFLIIPPTSHQNNRFNGANGLQRTFMQNVHMREKRSQLLTCHKFLVCISCAQSVGEGAVLILDR